MSLTWTARDSSRNWSSVASSSDGTKLVATVNNGQIYTSTDSGTTWTARDSTRYWYKVASSSDGTKLVACETYTGGKIYTSTDSGVTWIARGGFGNWSSVASSSNGTKLVAVASNGQIYTSTDSGVNWTARESNRAWRDVASSSDGTRLVAVAQNSQIYTSTDSGVTWIARETARNWYRVASSSDGTKLVACVVPGQIYTSTDSGVNWTAGETSRWWYSVASSSDGTKLVACAGEGDKIYISTNAGVSWTATESNRNWTGVTSSSDGTQIVAVVQNGQIYTGTPPPLYTAPGAPTGVSAVAGNKSAAVSFTAPASTGGAAISSYRVTSSPGSITATGASSPITVTGLTAGTSYTFTVTATNAQSLTSVASSASNSVTVFDVPSTPATPSTVSGDTDITVSWAAPSNGGSAITGYKLRYSSNGGSSWGAATSVGNVLTYNVSGLTDNTNYQFQVAATNTAGDSAWSTATGNVQTITTPSAPQNVVLTAQQNAIKVDWQAPSNNGGSAITGYTIRYRIQGSAAALTEIDNISPQNTSSTKTYTITSLVAGSLYDVYVYAFSAIDVAKQGAAAYVSATPYDVPGAPQSVTAVGGNGYVDISFSAAASNGNTITLYTVSTTGKANVTGTTSPIRMSGLTNGQQYTFSLTATNAAGVGTAATVKAVPIDPSVTSISESAISVSNTTEVAQVLTSLSSASTAVFEQAANYSLSQLATSNPSVSPLDNAATINLSISNASLRQSVARAAGNVSMVTTASSASAIAEKLATYQGRIDTVRSSATASLPALVKEVVQGAVEAVLNISGESITVKLASALITGNSEIGANRLTMKNATVAAVETAYSGTSIAVSGDTLTSLKSSIPIKTTALDNTTSLSILVADPNTRTIMLPVNGVAVYIPMISNVSYTLGNAAGSETTVFMFNAADNTMTKDGSSLSSGDIFVLNGVEYPLLGIGSAPIGPGSIPSKPVEVNLNVQIDASGDITILSQTGPTIGNLVIPTRTLPVDCLYDSSNNIGLIEFWEPEERGAIECRLATSFTLGSDAGYKVTAKKLALGLQNLLVGPLDASGAMPFSDSRYDGANADNNRKMNGFGRLALMAYAHYIMGHVQATAAITNDSSFIKSMLSLNSNTADLEDIKSTDYAYASIGNYNGELPWTLDGSASDANLAIRLVNTLIDANLSSGSEAISTIETGSAPATSSVANIVKQVIGQDASRARDADNSKYTPEVKGLLKFIAGDVIYVSILLIAPNVSVGAGQRVEKSVLESLYAPTSGDNTYTLKITLA